MYVFNENYFFIHSLINIEIHFKTFNSFKNNYKLSLCYGLTTNHISHQLLLL